MARVPEEECPVCLEPLPPPEERGSARADCGHRAHVACLARWARVRPDCPVCKTALYAVDPEEGRVEETSNDGQHVTGPVSVVIARTRHALRAGETTKLFIVGVSCFLLGTFLASSSDSC